MPATVSPNIVNYVVIDLHMSMFESYTICPNVNGLTSTEINYNKHKHIN